MKSIITTCADDCPDNCGMIAEVEDGRLVSVKGNPDHGFTRGYLCKRGYKYPQRIYSPYRMLHPMKKTPDGWARISWDEALDTIAAKIAFFAKEYGWPSIMHFQRSASWGASKHLVRRFFNLLGDVTMQTGSLCAGSVMAAQKADMGERLGNDPSDVVNSKVVIIWGKDPVKSSRHIVPFLKEAQKNGTKVILVDPIKTKTAALADMYIAPKAGSDGFLALGIAKELIRTGLTDRAFIEEHAAGYDKFEAMAASVSTDEICERCGIDSRTIEALAALYGNARPASIILGYGINKWVHGPDMIRLIDALGCLTGNIGKAGGGVNHGFATRRHFDPKVMAPIARSHRLISEPRLGPGILESKDPPVRMIWINGTNPAASCPDSHSVIKALKGLDFVVVVDHFMTDTAELADIFLPAATFLEEDDVVVSWGHNWIGPVNAAIEPPGEAKSDLRIVQELALRCGLGDEMAGTTREWLKRLMSPMERLGLTVEKLMESPVRCPVAPQVAFEGGTFKTPSGRFELVDKLPPAQESGRPFHLLSVLSNTWLNSLILENEHPEVPVALLHTKAAGPLGLKSGSRATVRTGAGGLDVEVRLSDDVGEDIIAIDYGTWMKHNGGVNQLTECRVSTSGEMAAYYSTTAEIEAVT